MGTKINLPARQKKKEKKRSSPAGNWTPVSRVTGGDTDHYTTEELRDNRVKQNWQQHEFGHVIAITLPPLFRSYLISRLT